VIVRANPGRWCYVEGRITVEHPAVPGDAVGGAARLLVDGEPLDTVIWNAMHVDPDDKVLGHLRIEVEA
jgi:hypothetical protein